jgi:phage tail sheath gpL-like
VFTTRSAAIANGRIFVVGPNLLDSSGAVSPGGVTAAAAAMVAENEPDPAKPVSSVAIQGFIGVEKVFLNSEYDTLHNGGVFTTTARDGNISIMRYLTTYISAAGTDVKEGTHAKTRDFVMNKMKTSLENKFRRSKVTNATLKQIENEIKGMIVLWKSQEIVNPDKASSVSATISETDPSKVDVNVSYFAVYPLNFINININLNL